MCSNYNVSARRQDLENYGIKLPSSFIPIDKRFFPKDLAPVIVKDKGILRLVGMNFSLIPSWSKTKKIKFHTYNARLETVMKKRSYSGPFQRYHCFVPMDGFFESAEYGPFVGNVIQFKPKETKLLFAAAIFDVWTESETGKQSYSFSILTTEPSPFILDHGHDRTPIFLRFEDAVTWLDLINNSNEAKNFLESKLIHPNLIIEIDRPLKAS